MNVINGRILTVKNSPNDPALACRVTAKTGIPDDIECRDFFRGYSLDANSRMQKPLNVNHSADAISGLEIYRHLFNRPPPPCLAVVCKDDGETSKEGTVEMSESGVANEALPAPPGGTRR